jgi:hypothetical protein
MFKLKHQFLKKFDDTKLPLCLVTFTASDYPFVWLLLQHLITPLSGYFYSI